MDQKCTNDTRFLYNNELDENLAWLIQNIQKVIKGILLSPHTVNVIELQSNKKSDNGPPLLQQPSFSGLSPPFKQNILYPPPPPPQVSQLLEGPNYEYPLKNFFNVLKIHWWCTFNMDWYWRATQSIWIIWIIWIWIQDIAN